ncbi:hypothetical protein QBC35DRAFT_480954 [Podospora australis]|uniref:Uncharacterized protein n=1 Tax=Podospora australis TaxID=1536484 RepID=A0AAN6X402_9PEZI|nr:hypothetical protein QBC35DRAFT_480954 [Podospora australis]
MQEGMDDSKTAFISYVWTVVQSHRELIVDGDLPSEIPRGFEELRGEILSYAKDLEEKAKITDEGKMGLYLVVNDDSLYSGDWDFEGHEHENYLRIMQLA